MLLFSRKSGDKIEYFLLLRTMPAEQAVGAKNIDRVEAGTDANGNPCIDLNLNKEGGERFHKLTDANKERQFAIVYNGEIFSALVIRAAISTRVQISGKFSKDDVDKMVTVLRAGSKPREEVALQ